MSNDEPEFLPSSNDFSKGANHSHACVICGFQQPCFYKGRNKKGQCKVDIAVLVNKQGPFCNLCRSAIMTARYANARNLGIEAVAELLDKVWSL